MESISTAFEGQETELIQYVNVLGSEGRIYTRGGKTFWYMNGTEKETGEIEPVWPIVYSAIERVRGEGKLGNINHIRISPAVTIHLFFEGHITSEAFQSTSDSDTEVFIDSSQLNLPQRIGIPFIVERNMLQRRKRSDIVLMDKNGQQL